LGKRKKKSSVAGTSEQRCESKRKEFLHLGWGLRAVYYVEKRGGDRIRALAEQVWVNTTLVTVGTKKECASAQKKKWVLGGGRKENGWNH